LYRCLSGGHADTSRDTSIPARHSRDTPRRCNAVTVIFTGGCMTRHLLPLILATTCCLLTGVAHAADAAPFGPTDPRGRWITQSGNLEVEIAPCGAALCGTVTKVLANNSMSRSGEPMTPADPRPALGMKLLIDLAPDEGETPASTWRGQVYNRENAKTYRCRVQVEAAPGAQAELLVRGYVGLPLFGQTQRWRRAAD
jgi:uncharacterized protein (DUF2147 family)